MCSYLVKYRRVERGYLYGKDGDGNLFGCAGVYFSDESVGGTHTVRPPHTSCERSRIVAKGRSEAAVAIGKDGKSICFEGIARPEVKDFVMVDIRNKLPLLSSYFSVLVASSGRKLVILSSEITRPAWFNVYVS